MASATLLVSAGVTTLAGLVYAYVATRLAQRQGTERGTTFALRCFALWWAALAANMLLLTPIYVAAAFDALPFSVQLLSSVLQRMLLAVSMVGLMAYFLYLLTGRARLGALIALYALYVAMLLASLGTQRPTGVAVHTWRTDLAYAKPGLGWMAAVSLLLIVLPPVLASIAYLRLLPRAATRTQRYRIAIVSTAILIWWVVAVVAGQAAYLDHAGIQIAGRILGPTVALLVLTAFAPPAWMQRRFGLEPARPTSA